MLKRFRSKQSLPDQNMLSVYYIDPTVVWCNSVLFYQMDNYLKLKLFKELINKGPSILLIYTPKKIYGYGNT
jgi:hypothetical protein